MEQSPWRAKDEFVLHNAHIEGADFSNIKPRYFNIGVGSVLVHCDFSCLKPQGWPSFGSGNQPTTYMDCIFDGMSVKGGSAGRASFQRCSFRRVKIKDFHFTDAQLVDCTFSGRLESVIFSARPDYASGRLENDFRGNDFSEARLEDVSFRGGIRLDLQRLPEGADYVIIPDAREVLREVWNIVEGWPQDLDQSRAQTKLEVCADELESGQRDLFLTKKFLAEGLSDARAQELIGLMASR